MKTLKTPKVVYLVSGETGEYSDRAEWPVAVFTDKDKANIFRNLCAEVVKGSEELDDDARGELKSPYDPRLRVDYTGAGYHMQEVPFDPKFQAGGKK